MRTIKTLLGVLLLAVPVYVAWPICSALEIRHAIKSGDTATLARKIEWDSLRASLKASITADTLARLEAQPDAPQPSVWQRVTAAVAPTVASSAIDRYVTPENLPWLLGVQKAYRERMRPALGVKEPTSALAGTWLDGTAIDRFGSFWRRVRSAVFFSPTRFQLEVEDKHRPGRRYIGTLELRGLEWKLTQLVITGGGL
jgi:hypothetical protein